MTAASQLRTGNCIRLNDGLYKILLAEFKVGTAKLPSSMHLRLRNLHTRTVTEQRLHPETRVEDFSVETLNMEFSYADGDSLHFMHPGTFELIPVPTSMFGRYARFLEPGGMVKIDFYGDEPIDVHVPLTVDVTVASTGAPLHGDVDAAPKGAVLTNGVEIQVPQFIKTGDRLRISLETGKYVERLK
jgi:elongation factor P